MPNFVNLTGRRFGRWTVIERAADYRSGMPAFRCRCDCGAEGVVRGQGLRAGTSRSCGCLQREVAREIGKRPKQPTIRSLFGRTPEYVAWDAMKDRCRRHPRYLGRGITVRSEWLHDFPAFLAHIGPRPGPEFSVDRINNNGNYEPGNVRWATLSQQSRNKTPSLASATLGQLLEEIERRRKIA